MVPEPTRGESLLQIRENRCPSGCAAVAQTVHEPHFPKRPVALEALADQLREGAAHL
jgi:hypothetical protein